MPTTKVTIDDSEVRTALRHAALAIERLPAREIVPVLEEARDSLRDAPELPGQKYIRTGRRYAAAKLITTPGNNQYSKSYRVESNPRYPGGRTGNPYVLGNAYGTGQARIHAGRWPLMFDVMNKALDKIVERAREYFRSVLERNGPP